MVIFSSHLCAYLEPRLWPGISIKALIHRQVFPVCVSAYVPVCDLHSFLGLPPIRCVSLLMRAEQVVCQSLLELKGPLIRFSTGICMYMCT